VKKLAPLLAALALLAAAPAASAAVERTNLPDIEDEVMCPVCGTPLNLAQSPQAERERVLIRRLIAQGRTKSEIKDRLKVEYGPEVIAEPDQGGFDVTAWVVPIVVVLGALAALLFVVPRWRRTRDVPEDAPDPDADLSPTDARRLDDELARFEG
jgi:cytochrome c-type biogenesis protein CcmH/NrfF